MKPCVRRGDISSAADRFATRIDVKSPIITLADMTLWEVVPHTLFNELVSGLLLLLVA